MRVSSHAIGKLVRLLLAAWLASCGALQAAGSEEVPPRLDRGEFFTIEDYLAWLDDTDESEKIRKLARTGAKMTFEVLEGGRGASVVNYRFETTSGFLLRSTLFSGPDRASAEQYSRAFVDSFSRSLQQNGAEMEQLPGGLDDVEADVRLHLVKRADGTPIGNQFTARHGNRSVMIEIVGPMAIDSMDLAQALLWPKAQRMLAIDEAAVVVAAKRVRPASIESDVQQDDWAQSRLVWIYAIWCFLGYLAGRLLAWLVNAVAGREWVPRRLAGLAGICLATALLVHFSVAAFSAVVKAQPDLPLDVRARLDGRSVGLPVGVGMSILVSVLICHALRRRPRQPAKAA